MHSDAADLILRSDAIFTAARNELFSGYVVIKNGAIAAMIANGEDIQTWRGERTRFIELGDRLICPGFCPRFYVSTSKSIIKALINMHSFEIQLSPIG